jgi:cyclopropane-fatty-acyl-phospholipid synthase
LGYRLAIIGYLLIVPIRLWLDSSLTYSSGLWDTLTLDDDLETAQQRKIDWHLNASGATTGKRLLDIGCG